MPIAENIVGVLLGEKDDYANLIAGDDDRMERMAWEAEARRKHAEEEKAAQEKAYWRKYADLAAGFKHIEPAKYTVPEWQVPARYYRAKSALWGLSKRKAGAAHVSSVELLGDASPPAITAGSRGGHFTMGGTPIEHPMAYSKRGWSNMQYVTNDQVVGVGIDWLFSRLPDYTTVLALFAQRDKSMAAGNKSVLQQWTEEQRQLHSRAYDA